MAFTTKVITDTSPDFGDNPQTVTENDRPASVEVDGLVANTGYWTKAEIWQNGVLNDTSEVETFTTLPAGTITLEHISTTRSGYGYDVAYRYTSTYAPSSAILSTNGTQFQGFIDSAQHAVSFWVTGLTAGTAYLTNVTLYDIYGESTTVMGSIVATVVNEVRITGTTPAQTSVDCELDYVIDSGFTTGWIDYWLGADDPATDQPQGHFYFNDGAEICTVSGLTAGTSYKFRATIVLGDGTTEVVSNVVTDTTVVDYATIPFTVENTDSETGVFTFKGWTNLSPNYDYSTDGGTTWTNIRLSSTDIRVNIPSGGTLQIKGGNTGSGMVYSTDNHAAFVFSKRFIIYGNVVSLFDKENYETLTYVTPSNANRFTFLNLLKNNTTLESAENLSFGNLKSIGQGLQFANMFYGCSNLKYAPKTIGISRNVTHNSAFNGMFWGCEKLTTVPIFENGFTIGNAKSTFASMFRGCTSLKKGLDMKNISCDYNSGYDNGSFVNMYYGCSSISLVYAPNITSYVSEFAGWLTNVPQNGTLHKRTLLNLPSNSADGVPSGWTVVNHLNY